MIIVFRALVVAIRIALSLSLSLLAIVIVLIDDEMINAVPTSPTCRWRYKEWVGERKSVGDLLSLPCLSPAPPYCGARILLGREPVDVFPPPLNGC